MTSVPTAVKFGIALLLSLWGLVACSQNPESPSLSKKVEAAAFPKSIIAYAEETETKEYPIIAATPEQICSDITYRDADGILRIGRRACTGASLCTLNGEKNCISSEAFPAVDLTGALIPALAKVHHNLTIFEHSGTMQDCSALGEKGCYTAPGTAAVNPATIDATKILSGYTLLGVSGTLPTCSLTVKQDCLVTTPRKAAVKCTDGASNCYLPAYSLGVEPHKAFDISTLDATTIKAGATIGGVTGTYPSASVPLSGSADGNSDLLSSTFAAQLATASNFAWFDRNGVRHVKMGEADFTSANILDGIDIFGVVGTLKLPDVWDVRAGKNVGTAGGKMKMNCRNGFDLNTFDMGLPKRVTAVDTTNDTFTITGHGFAADDQVKMLYTLAPVGFSTSTIYYVIPVDANTIKLSTSAGGAAVDVTTAGTNLTIFRWQDGAHQSFDSIDYYNAAGPLVTSASGSDEAAFCEGVYPGNANGLWEDVTTGSCSALADECVFRDRITRLEWSEAFDASQFSYSYVRCDALDFNGHDDWRLPTQKELMTALAHNMRSVNKPVWIDDTAFASSFWTTTGHLLGTETYVAGITGPLSINVERSESFHTVCVRGGP